jgi:hypothetical protein
MHRCSTQVKSVEEYRDNLVTRAIQNVDNGQVMNLKMNFYILYSSSEMNLLEDLIKENLKVLTETYMGTHPDYAKMPEEGRYNFKSIVGTPNIRFMYGGIIKRIDISQDSILKNISTSEFPVTLIETYMAKNNISDPGSIYVFTADTGDILGQTHPSKPLCVINYKAIGGYSQHGISTTYGLGKTLCHETGHMFDLPHTFTGTCDQLFDDIPSQKNENYEFFLTQNNQGKWDGARKEGGDRKPRTFFERPKPEFDQKMVSIRRVTRVVAGGRRMTFAVAIAIGDKKGSVGLGTGKGGDTAVAIAKALRQAKKNMFKIKTTKDMSIPHEVHDKFSSSKLSIMPNHGKVLEEEGPDHDKIFRVGIYFNDDLIEEGEGKSKQEAETVAARKALEKKGWA